MTDVYVIGVGMTHFGKHIDRSIKDLTRESVTDALVDAGIKKEHLQAAWFANSTWGFFSGQDQIRGQVALGAMGIFAIPIMNVEAACGGGSQAMHGAWLAVCSGAYDCVLAVGSEKLYHPEKVKSFKALSAGTDVERIPEMNALWRGRFEQLGLIKKSDMSSSGPQKFGPMMEMYALMVRDHMNTYGLTQRQLAVIAAKDHYHGSLNPRAQYQKPMTADEVLAAKPIVYPLTAPMCAPLGDGSAAAIVCSADFLKTMKIKRAVKILASVYGSNTPRTFDDRENGIALRLSQKAYEMAGVGPEDVDFIEVHDAASFAEVGIAEQLGFCPVGEGGRFAESGATSLGGQLPINVSGGLVSRGHPLGATGVAQIYELVTQLRGEAGERQVQGARVGLSENGGGQIHFEEASMGIHILANEKF